MSDKGPEVTEQNETEPPERNWRVVYTYRCRPPPFTSLPLVRAAVKQLFSRDEFYVEIRKPPVETK